MDLRLPADPLDFDQLVEWGRSLIPGLAPAWTDHNAHDPGIMLLELLAFVADAQIYAVSRTRRDERLAYARLLGIEPAPPRPASGLVWPDGPAEGRRAAFADRIVAAGAAMLPDYPAAAVFRASRAAWLSGARLAQVLTRDAEGAVVDQTVANAANGASYQPFGAVARPGASLALRFDMGVAPPRNAGRGLFHLGVEAARPAKAAAGADGPCRLVATIRDGRGERGVRVVSDTSMGLASHGCVALDLSTALPIEARFDIVLSSATGWFLRTPRVRRIVADLVPVEQVERIALEEAPGFGRGAPDQVYRLARAGLVAPESLQVRTLGPGEPSDWRATRDLSGEGPDDRCFSLDVATGELRFGNGLNGSIPAADAVLQVDYEVTQGAGGNLPRNVVWRLADEAEPFGRNLKEIAGGADAERLEDLQARAQDAFAAPVTAITAADLADQALAQDDLGVGRAVELRDGRNGLPGLRVLLAAGRGDDDEPPGRESDEWVGELARRLSPVLPLGQRLEVRRPVAVPVRIMATIISSPGAPADIERRARIELARRLNGPGAAPWPLGRDLARLTVAAWLRGLDGVARVEGVRLWREGVEVTPTIRLEAHELPHLVIHPGDLRVTPAGRGGLQ